MNMHNLITLFEGLLVGYVVARLIRYIWSKNNKKEEIEFEYDANVEESNQIDYTDFDEKMFEQVRNGEKYQHFLNISNHADCALIRSMLASADIYSYIENEKMNGAYGGIANTMNQLFCIKLYILQKDYDEALEIVSDFIKNIVERLSKGSDKSKFKKTLLTLASIAAAPYSIDKDNELLGITIMPKEK